MRTLFLLLFLTTLGTPVLSQSPQYKNKIFLAGKDYFWDLIFDGWSGKQYNWNLMQKVYMYNDSSREFQEYLDLPGPCQKVATNAVGDKIALILVVPAGEKDVGEHYLRILDSRGKKIIEIANVYDFQWLQAEDTLVYLTGRSSETDEIGGFAPSGVWILDFKTQTTNKISERGYWLFIDESSTSIYIDEYWKVKVYNYSSGTLSETKFMGNFFSPDRKYYYRTPGGYWPFVVYETRTNTPVKIAATTDTVVEYAQWMPTKEHALIVGDRHAEKKVVDIPTGKVLGSLSGTILGFIEQTEEFLVHRNKQYLKGISESSFEWIKVE